MPEIIVYTTSSCPFCFRAKELLSRRGLPYTEVDVEDDAAMRRQMTQITGRRSVPQIIVDGNPVGGYQELVALAERGEL